MMMTSVRIAHKRHVHHLNASEAQPNAKASVRRQYHAAACLAHHDDVGVTKWSVIRCRRRAPIIIVIIIIIQVRRRSLRGIIICRYTEQQKCGACPPE
jgi:hypothetical protein